MIVSRKLQMTNELKLKISNSIKKKNSIRKTGNIKSWPNFVDPNGRIHTDIVDMSEFAKKFNLNANKMREVAKGNAKSHRGWKLSENV